MKKELRKFVCPKGHLFFAPVWLNYLQCPMFCGKMADMIEDITVECSKRLYKGVGSGFPILPLEKLNKNKKVKNGN